MVVLMATIVTVLAHPYHMVAVGDDPEKEKVVVVSLMMHSSPSGPVTDSEVVVKMEMLPSTGASPGVSIHRMEVIL